MPAAPAVYCSAARASQLRLRVAPGSGQPAAPSALRGGRTLRLRCLPLAALRIHSLRSGHGLPGVRHAQVGSVPRGGAHSATAAGLLRFSSRSRVAVGCGIRSRLSLRGLQAPPRGRRRLTLTHGRGGAESASPTGSDAHAPASEPDSVPSDTMPRKSAPKPLTGPRGLPNRKSDTRRPSRGAGARAPGRSRRPHRRRDHPAAARAPVRPHGRFVCASAPAGAAASLASDIISSAPARPSPAPRGGARAPAPRPGLRCRHPNRRGSQRTRQTPLRASQRPRPRRTTWLGTPTAP